MKISAVIFATFVAACGGSESGGAVEPTPPAPTADPVAPASVLGLAELTIFIEGNEAIKVHADGSIEANMDGSWKTVGTIKDDTITAEGKTVASVDSEGSVTFANGPSEGIKLSGGTVSFGPNTVGIGDDGVVTGMNPEAEGKVRVEGATDEASKHTALIMIVSIFATAKAETVEAPVESKPEATP